MSSQPFLRAVSDFVMDISGLVNIRPTPGTTDNSGIRFYRGNGSYVGLTADNTGTGDVMYSFPSVGSAGEVLSIKSGGELNWVSAQSGQKGDTGAQGPDGNFGGATFDYTYSTTTTAGDPGRGNIRLNDNKSSLKILLKLNIKKFVYLKIIRIKIFISIPINKNFFLAFAFDIDMKFEK